MNSPKVEICALDQHIPYNYTTYLLLVFFPQDFPKMILNLSLCSPVLIISYSLIREGGIPHPESMRWMNA